VNAIRKVSSGQSDMSDLLAKKLVD